MGFKASGSLFVIFFEVMTLKSQKSAVWKAQMESELLKRLGWLLFQFGMSKHKFLNHSWGRGIPGEYAKASTVGLVLETAVRR